MNIVNRLRVQYYMSENFMGEACDAQYRTYHVVNQVLGVDGGGGHGKAVCHHIAQLLGRLPHQAQPTAKFQLREWICVGKDI